MKKTKIVLLLPIICCCFTFTFNSCKKNRNTIEKEEIQVSLQKIADSVYNTFNKKWSIDNHGVLIYVTGPSGVNMVSSNIKEIPTPESDFRVASISKTFTAAAIMLLHQQDALNINDFINNYLPNTTAYNIPFKNQITIKQLLQHRSGVFDITNQNMPDDIDAPFAGKKYEDYIRDQDDQHTFTFDELVGLNAKFKLSTASPGAGFYYSNTGYNILGKIIEVVSGISYSDFITQKFIIPLGLINTYSIWEGSDVEMRPPYINSTLYLKGRDGLETSKDNVSVHVTEGNIVSSPKDITTWIKLLLTGKAGVNSSNVALMKEMLPADAGHGVYGLGMVYNEELGYGHNGIHKSYVSCLRYNPKNGITVLVVANFLWIDPKVNSNDSVYELGFGIINTAQAVVREYQK